MPVVYLGLGSNIGDRYANLEHAVSRIVALAGTLLGRSRVYETSPWGFDSNENFLNMALEIDTPLDASTLLATLLGIETEMGRVRSGEGYSSRVIDLDILFYGSEIIDLPDLAVPHPFILSRRFVLTPLSEIAPSFIDPVTGITVSQLLSECKDDSSVELYTGDSLLFPL